MRSRDTDFFFFFYFLLVDLRAHYRRPLLWSPPSPLWQQNKACQHGIWFSTVIIFPSPIAVIQNVSCWVLHVMTHEMNWKIYLDQREGICWRDIAAHYEVTVNLFYIYFFIRQEMILVKKYVCVYWTNQTQCKDGTCHGVKRKWRVLFHNALHPFRKTRSL